MSQPFYEGNLAPGDVFVDRFGNEYVLDGYWSGQVVVQLRSINGDQRLTFGSGGLTAEEFTKTGRNVLPQAGARQEP